MSDRVSIIWHLTKEPSQGCCYQRRNKPATTTTRVVVVCEDRKKEGGQQKSKESSPGRWTAPGCLPGLRWVADTNPTRQGESVQQIITSLASPPHGLLKGRDGTGRSHIV